MSKPEDEKARQMLQLRKYLERHWREIVTSEEEGGVDSFSKLPEAILVRCGESTWEFDLTDRHNDPEIQDTSDVMQMIMDNIAYHLDIPLDQQAFVTRQGHKVDIDSSESVAQALSGRRPLLRVVDSAQSHGVAAEDLDSTMAPSEPAGRGILEVMFQGEKHKWLDIEEIEKVTSGHPDGLDTLLRENIERHFGVPVAHQDIFGEHGGRVASAADFRRVLQSVNPLLKLYDLRTMHASIGSPSKQVPEVPAPSPVSSVIQQPAYTFSPQSALQPSLYSRASLRPESSRGWAVGDHLRRKHFARATTFDNQTKPLGWSQGLVEVELRKEKPGDIFGFAIEHDKEYRFLYVGAVVSDGLLAKWNRENAVFSLREGDAILEVNNEASDSRAMEWVLTHSNHVRLECQRR